MLANEWEQTELEDWGLDGFPFEDKVLEAEEDNFEVPDEIKTDIVLGDLFEIGEHRLLCGDSTDSDQVAKLMNGQKADMVFTDPPYGISVKNTKGDILGDENLNVFEECMPNILLSVKESTHAYIFFGSKLAEQSLLILNKYFKQYNLLIMPITNQTQPYPEGYFSSNYEICYFTNINGVKKHNSGIISVSETTKKDNRYNGDGFLKKYYALSEQPITEHNANVLHPTQKNVNGIDFYIKISSNQNNLVLDLFLGSGSTMVASHQLKRKCYGMEIDPKYCQVIIDRMKKLDSNLVIKRNGINIE
jgi:DNA modification methylase